MLTLGLDTTGKACSAALVDEGRIIAHASEPIGRGHAERLAPLVKDMIYKAGRNVSDISRVGVCTGPGSFTGQRVALSFAKGEPVSTNRADTFADGLACRVPATDAVPVICKYAARVITVSEDEIRNAMRLYYTATHNLSEGAGAAALAGLLQERSIMAGKTVGVVLSGGNIDRALYQHILSN